MPYELIAMIFDHVEVAKDAWQALQSMPITGRDGSEIAVLLEKDPSGVVSIKQYKPLTDQEQDPNEAFLTLFAATVFGDSQAGQAYDVLVSEIDESYIEEIRQAWQPERCALLVFIPRHSLVDAKGLKNHLVQYRGILVHTSFPERTIKSILELFDIAESQT